MNKVLAEARKQNMKIFALYRAISLDLIFYYVIDFLFLTQVKNISASDVVLSSAFYAVFMIILQIPASIIVDKLGTRKCTILGNVFNAMFVLLVITCTNLQSLIFAQFISALCFSLKDISDDTLLRYSIPESKNKGDIYSKIEGQGYKNYYYLRAISSVLSGFLYVVNPYIPMIIALIFTIISIVISLGFKDIEEEKRKQGNKEETHMSARKYFIQLKEGMKFILNSQRLRSLFIYGGLAWGIFCLIGTYGNSILVDIGAPAQIITTIAAITGIASAMGSKHQLQFNKKLKNKSLSTILIMVTFSILVCGITVILKIPYDTSLLVIVIGNLIISYAKGLSRSINNKIFRKLF